MTATALALLVLIVLVLLAVAAVTRSRSRAARLDRPDEVLARQRIDAISRLPAPEDLPRAPDATKAMRRRFTRREHPIARKRSGRNI